MHRVALLFVAFVLAFPGRSAIAGEDLVPLSRIAPQLGYTYTWLASEAAVALTRPGVYVLIRTGNPLYDVNDAVESTTEVPQFRNNDIFIGPSLVARLRSLAGNSTATHPSESMTVSRRLIASAPVHGALTVTVSSTHTADAVIVAGKGPPSVPVTITLTADISREIPRVLLSRTYAETDKDGNFTARLSSAPLYFQKSTIYVAVTSLVGITEADTSFALGQPNPGVAHPVDELPRDFRPL
jgi:hypothetical protein